MPKKPQPPASPAEVRAWRDAVKPLKRLGISLYDQQLWCWGYDIREPGNLFLRYGFTQHRQDKSCGGTVYSLALGEGVMLRLWGGNLVYVVEGVGAIHLKRYEFEPRLLPRGYVLSFAPPEVSEVPQTPDECILAATLAISCMRWIAEYERWVIANAGCEHRARAVQAWKQNAVFLIEAERMGALWDENAHALENYVEAARVPTAG